MHSFKSEMHREREREKRNESPKHFAAIVWEVLQQLEPGERWQEQSHPIETPKTFHVFSLVFCVFIRFLLVFMCFLYDFLFVHARFHSFLIRFCLFLFVFIRFCLFLFPLLFIRFY